MRRSGVIGVQRDRSHALLGPIFANQNEARNAVAAKEPEHKPEDLLVVQLVPLTTEQRQALAAAAGVERTDAFVEGIERHGLDALAERPGDLLDLAEYWKNQHRFGSLVEMTEQGVTRKLTERDKFRPDNRDLSLERARQGGERLAAALTLAKSFTLRAPGHDPDPTLAAGALDPVSVLDDWADAERNALIRRGVFAPSTYGRVRFHHRATQEYLTAKWLNRLLQPGSPRDARDAVWELIFADRYGIETLVPSLHGTAAWLALDHRDIRDEMIRREPLVLLRYGDSRSLPLEAKERLLFTYAERHRAGEIANDSLDRRALWMFATPDLAGAIRRSWTINDRRDFRIDLLRVVREGAIRACVDLARGTLVDEAGDDYLRMVALEAVDVCGDVEGLAAAARWLVAASAPATARLAPHFAKVLFPHYLSVDELLDLIERFPSPNERSHEGFGDVTRALWEACPDAAARERFIAGVADLCLAPPFAAHHLRISAHHYGFAANITALGRDAVLALGGAEPCDGLVRLLMVIERAEPRAAADQEGPPLSTLVSANQRLQRRLFWADVDETRRNANLGEEHPTRVWQVHVHGGRLWRLGPEDLSWLYEDLAARPFEPDRRVALSALVAVLTNAGTFGAEAPRLRRRVAGWGELERDLNAYLAPPVESEEALRLRRRQSTIQRQWEEKERKDRASWVEFRDEIRADPSVLCDPVLLANWAKGASRLHYLTNWLRHRTKDGEAEAVLQWRLLEEAFGRAVAEAYRDGMKALWRVTAPERPKHTKDNRVTVKYATILSVAGLGVEAAEHPDWASRLVPAEAERAALHGCLSEQGYPYWIEALIDRQPGVTLPIVRRTLQQEWSGRYGSRTDLLSHYGWSDRPVSPSVQQLLFEAVTGKTPKNREMLDCALRILRYLDLNDAQRRRTATLALRRLRAAKVANEDGGVRRYLAMLFLVDAESRHG